MRAVAHANALQPLKRVVRNACCAVEVIALGETASRSCEMNIDRGTKPWRSAASQRDAAGGSVVHNIDVLLTTEVMLSNSGPNSLPAGSLQDSLGLCRIYRFELQHYRVTSAL